MDMIPGWPVGKDKELHEFYKKHLLIRGWAGVMTPEEIKYVRSAKPPSEAKREQGRRLAERNRDKK